MSESSLQYTSLFCTSFYPKQGAVQAHYCKKHIVPVVSIFENLCPAEKRRIKGLISRALQLTYRIRRAVLMLGIQTHDARRAIKPIESVDRQLSPSPAQVSLKANKMGLEPVRL